VMLSSKWRRRRVDVQGEEVGGRGGVRSNVQVYKTPDELTTSYTVHTTLPCLPFPNDCASAASPTPSSALHGVNLRQSKDLNPGTDLAHTSAKRRFDGQADARLMP
jgi:hypothetical protein